MGLNDGTELSAKKPRHDERRGSMEFLGCLNRSAGNEVHLCGCRYGRIDDSGVEAGEGPAGRTVHTEML